MAPATVREAAETLDDSRRARTVRQNGSIAVGGVPHAAVRLLRMFSAAPATDAGTRFTVIPDAPSIPPIMTHNDMRMIQCVDGAARSGARRGNPDEPFTHSPERTGHAEDKRGRGSRLSSASSLVILRFLRVTYTESARRLDLTQSEFFSRIGVLSST